MRTEPTAILPDADAAGQSGQDNLHLHRAGRLPGTDAGTIHHQPGQRQHSARSPADDLSSPPSAATSTKYEGGLVREGQSLPGTIWKGDAIASVSIGGVALPRPAR